MADLPTVAPRRTDVATLVLLALSTAIAVLAVAVLVQLNAASAAAQAQVGPGGQPLLSAEDITHQQVLMHLTSLRRFAGVALASSAAVVGAALLLRRASRRLAGGRW